jgi:hypothetical protein
MLAGLLKQCGCAFELRCSGLLIANVLTGLKTTYRRIIEKFKIHSPSQEIRRYLRSMKVRLHFQNSQFLIPILSQIHPAHPPPLRFILILSSQVKIIA